VIQIGDSMHRVRKFERAAIVFRIVLGAIITCENEPITARFFT